MASNSYAVHAKKHKQHICKDFFVRFTAVLLGLCLDLAQVPFNIKCKCPKTESLILLCWSYFTSKLGQEKAKLTFIS